jgi:hypothetical protein
VPEEFSLNILHGENLKSHTQYLDCLYRGQAFRQVCSPI